MAYTYSFFDDQTAGAEKLNKWTSLFVTEGVADCFEDGVPYSLSKLNDMVRNNCSSGVVPESDNTLKVTLTGDKVSIAPGVAFFEDGSVIEITSTEVLSFVPGKKQYVYLKSSVSENRAYPVVSEAEPGYNCVPLAEISESGDLADKRMYAKGKVPSFYASDARLPGYTTFTIDAPGDYLISHGGHSYTKLFFKGRLPIKENADESLGLVYFAADLNSLCSESLGISPNSLKQSGFDSDDVWWKNTNNGTVTLFKMRNLGLYYAVDGEIVQQEDKLYLRVRFTGTASEDRYYKNGYGVPMHCQVFLV